MYGGEEYLKPAEVMALFGVSASTLDRWSKVHLLTPMRTPGGHRRYPAAEVRRLLTERENT